MGYHDKRDFDYTSRIIAQTRSRGYGYLKSQDPIVEYPSWGDERLCSNCIHWVKEYKTHGQMYCNLKDSDYCRSHDKPYWRRKPTFKPFLSEEDMEIE